MTPRESFLYYVMGMVNLKLMTDKDYSELTPTESRTRTFHTMNRFLSDCNQPPMMPFEIPYIDRTQTFDKQLDDGNKRNKRTSRE